jgi:glycosyltransferase involved in cell wall biosynthesis
VAFVQCSYGFLSTYPPTPCGLATFTYALMRSLTSPESGDRAAVVRVVDTPVASHAHEVVGYLQSHAQGAHRAAAVALNAFDVAVIQHEYGIFGGQDGDQLLAVLDEMRVPIVVVVHTVLASPTHHQRHVLAQVISASDAVVTMTDVARRRLVAGYSVDPDKVVVIPHGAPLYRRRGDVNPAELASGTLGNPAKLASGTLGNSAGKPLILTWGLLGPGKGIEWAIDGVQRLNGLRPRPAYIVAGQTHPKVRQQQGETYRRQLAERARAVGVSHLVRFADSYLDDEALTRLVRRADVVLLPYDSCEQVTSGVLVEAVAAGKPVVATAFPHAVEMLASGAGVIVPHRDGAAIGDALYQVLTEPDRARRMAVEAMRLAPALLWPAVAERYRSLTANLLANRTSVLG